MFMKFIGLHGIYSNGEKSTSRVLNILSARGYNTTNVDYRMGLFTTYNDSKIKEIVDRVFDIYEDGDVIIAHSAGALITLRLLERLQLYARKIPIIWFLQGSLDRDARFPVDSYDRIYNVYDRHDIVLFLAQLLPGNNLGALGHFGYCGPSENVVNWRLRHDFELDEDAHGHGNVFDRGTIEVVVERIIESITEVQNNNVESNTNRER
jgi:hypothetical protein